MQRRVERKYIDAWVSENRPDAITKLASKSKVTASYLESVRAGHVPPKELYRDAIADALGVSAEVLFPVVEPVSAGKARSKVS